MVYEVFHRFLESPEFNGRTAIKFIDQHFITSVC